MSGSPLAPALDKRPPHPAWSGALCMLLAVLCFTLLDAIAKGLVGGAMHPLQVAWGRYAFSLLPLLGLAIIAGRKRLATARPTLQFARGLALISATAAMFAGLRLLKLSDAYALSYVSPVLVAVLSWYAFRERLRRSQWAALGVGICGVMIVIRPAFSQAGGAVVYPLLTAVCYAAYQVLTRLARRTDDAIVCVFYASLVGTVILTLIMPFLWQPMPAGYWLRFGAMGGLGLIGHWLLAVAAFRAPPSLLAPLTYVQLVYAALIDLAAFGNLPDHWTLAGSAVILASGVLLWRRTASG
ncbi:MAG: DMT family transporter [Casimicrobiaceae bacterium]